jgi:cysteine-rich repeat protein
MTPSQPSVRVAALRALALLVLVPAPAALASTRTCFKVPFADVIVNDIRTQIDEQCECTESTLIADRAGYKQCARNVVRQATRDGWLPTACTGVVLQGVTRSSCGLPGKDPCCIPHFLGQNVCLIAPTSQCESLVIRTPPQATFGATPSCYDACPASWTSTCGNGIIEPGELCDHGSANGTPGDSCSSTCQPALSPGCVAVSTEEYLGTFAQTLSFQSVLAQYRTPLGNPVSHASSPPPHIAYAMKCTDDQTQVTTYGAVMAQSVYKFHGAYRLRGFLLSRSDQTIFYNIDYDALRTFSKVLFETGNLTFSASYSPQAWVSSLSGNRVHGTSGLLSAQTVLVDPSPCNARVQQQLVCFVDDLYSFEHLADLGGCISGIGGLILGAINGDLDGGILAAIGLAALVHDCHALFPPLDKCPLSRDCWTDDCTAGTCGAFGCLANNPQAPSPCTGNSACNEESGTCFPCPPCTFAAGGLCINLCSDCQTCKAGACANACNGDGHCGADGECHGCPYP